MAAIPHTWSTADQQLLLSSVLSYSFDYFSLFIEFEYFKRLNSETLHAGKSTAILCTQFHEINSNDSKLK